MSSPPRIDRRSARTQIQIFQLSIWMCICHWCDFQSTLELKILEILVTGLMRMTLQNEGEPLAARSVTMIIGIESNTA